MRVVEIIHIYLGRVARARLPFDFDLFLYCDWLSCLLLPCSMGSGSPAAFLLWAILASLFFCFLVFHLWAYDRFKCLRWSESRRQPGAFKRVMSYTYIATLTLLVIFSVAFTFLKFTEGYVLSPTGGMLPKPLEAFSPEHRKWVLPLLFVLSVAWGCELVTHLEGTVVAMLGMPLTTLIARRELDLCLAWIFLVGSSASTATSLGFLFILWRFPSFIRGVKDGEAQPNVVLRLVLFYQLNCGRIIFRFLYSIPLFVVGIDGVQGPHTIDGSPFWSDFLLMMGGIGSFVSSAMTLFIFFPRSLTQELGYTIVLQPGAVAKTPATTSVDLRQPSSPHGRPSSPKHAALAHIQMPSTRLSQDSRHDATPGYELDDPGNTTHAHSHEGHLPMQVWDLHGAETPRTSEVPYPESYVFDRHSRSLVRSRSEGNMPGLHPYVLSFRSPIDICNTEADQDVPER
ncbi:hypothetical protein F5I97DRAFT_226430 [Phlebopus sp. FC_14]|nr:hypothetical protein F5I97DRAFT_226430 [Phlebopus sp. FC_14]